MSPQLTQSEAEFWNGRQAAASDDRALLNVWIDRARAVASKAERQGDTGARYSLIQTLHDWCQRHGG